MNNNADPNRLTRKFNETLLEAASVRGVYPLVAVLLQHKKSKVSADDIFQILPKLFQSDFGLKNMEIYRKYVLELLLNKLLKFQNEGEMFDCKQRRTLNQTLLRLNLRCSLTKTDDRRNIYQILKLGASLAYAKEKQSKSVIEQLNYEVLKTHFEDCVKDETFFYDSIVQDFDDELFYSETTILTYLTKDSEKKDLLTTPVIKVLVYEKWSKIRLFLYLDLCLYCLFLLTMYVYLITTIYRIETLWFKGLFFVFLLCQIAKEALQVWSYRCKYFKCLPNYLEMSMLALSIVCIFYPHDIVKIYLILVSTLVLFWFFDEIPTFIRFTYLLRSLKDFLLHACFYILPFFSFALCIHILFPYRNESIFTSADSNSTTYVVVSNMTSQISKHFYESLILFTGEFNERFVQSTKFPVLGRCFMTLFILCVTIALNNLLVGLLVSDMSDIKEKARIYILVKMTKFLDRTKTISIQMQKFKRFESIQRCAKSAQIFEMGKTKKITLNEKQRRYLDRENMKQLDELKQKRWNLYDDNVLQKVFNVVYY